MVRLLPCLAALLVWAPAVAWAAAPIVSLGANPPTIDDTQTSLPFAAANITDIDGDNVAIQITFTAGRGTFPTGPAATDLKNPSPGTYTLSARLPAAAATFLKTLPFTPAKNRIPRIWRKFESGAEGIKPSWSFDRKSSDRSVPCRRAI